MIMWLVTNMKIAINANRFSCIYLSEYSKELVIDCVCVCVCVRERERMCVRV